MYQFLNSAALLSAKGLDQHFYAVKSAYLTNKRKGVRQLFPRGGQGKFNELDCDPLSLDDLSL